MVLHRLSERLSLSAYVAPPANEVEDEGLEAAALFPVLPLPGFVWAHSQQPFSLLPSVTGGNK